MIEVSHLSKSYGEIDAVKDISFQVDRGEIVGFLGPNGAGKSTMKVLTCYMAPTAGAITVDGVDIADDPLAVRQKLGYLPESNPLYTDMLVYDYLAYVARIRGVSSERVHSRIQAVCEMCGLKDRIAQTISTLSKGYRQRVGLAQALIHDPDFLILDEPTSGLDPNQIVEIRNLIRELGKDRTVLLSTHNLPEVMATCNRMLIIHEGRLVADGTPEALQRQEVDNPLIRVVLTGVEADEAREALEALEACDTITSALTAVAGGVAFDVRCVAGQDARQSIFRMASTRGWDLIELHREVLDLEGIFRKLTQVV
jgi:ABC-2 type transport system ATP-binding protein